MQKWAYLTSYCGRSHGQQRLDDMRSKTVFDEHLVSIERKSERETIKQMENDGVLTSLSGCP
jgi:hypothetical protein